MVWARPFLLTHSGRRLSCPIFCSLALRCYRRVLLATQLSLLFEAWEPVEEREYSAILALMRVVEVLLESVPQLLLQLYALLVLWIEESSSPSRVVWRVVSECISATSMAYAASDVCSVEQPLLATGAGDGVARFGLCPGCPSLTGIFSRLPDKGASTFGGIG